MQQPPSRNTIMEEVKKIIADIKMKHFKPVYFLMGEESYYIDRISDYISDTVLTEEERSFNHMVLYGKDVTINDIVSNARRFPLMAEHQVIIVKEAQDLVKTIDQLDAYFDNIQPSTILVFCYKYKTLDKRKKVYKSLQKHGLIYESKKLRDYQMEGWLKQVLATKKYTIDSKAAAMLVEFLGTDLNKIANELSKLQIILPAGTQITPDHVEENIGISKEFNNFELIKAIAERNTTAAYKIAYYFAQNTKNNPFVLTMGLLYNYFSKLLQYHGMIYKNAQANPKTIAAEIKVSEYALKDYQAGVRNYPMKIASRNISYLREFDLKSKGVEANAMPHYDLLTEMLAKLFN